MSRPRLTKNLILEREHDDGDDNLLYLRQDLRRRVYGRDDGRNGLRDAHRGKYLVFACLVHDALQVDGLAISGLLCCDALSDKTGVSLALRAVV